VHEHEAVPSHQEGVKLEDNQKIAEDKAVNLEANEE
jgi:hypothetical protein